MSHSKEAMTSASLNSCELPPSLAGTCSLKFPPQRQHTPDPSSARKTSLASSNMPLSPLLPPPSGPKSILVAGASGFNPKELVEAEAEASANPENPNTHSNPSRAVAGVRGKAKHLPIPVKEATTNTSLSQRSQVRAAAKAPSPSRPPNNDSLPPPPLPPLSATSSVACPVGGRLSLFWQRWTWAPILGS